MSFFPTEWINSKHEVSVACSASKHVEITIKFRDLHLTHKLPCVFLLLHAFLWLYWEAVSTAWDWGKFEICFDINIIPSPSAQVYQLEGLEKVWDVILRRCHNTLYISTLQLISTSHGALLEKFSIKYDQEFDNLIKIAKSFFQILTNILQTSARPEAFKSFRDRKSDRTSLKNCTWR